jgi:hypothetical protein
LAEAESTPREGTDIGLDVSVDELVFNQVLLAGESVAAETTAEGSYIQVGGVHVASKVELGAENFLAILVVAQIALMLHVA